jgi:hypothetical protein
MEQNLLKNLMFLSNLIQCENLFWLARTIWLVHIVSIKYWNCQQTVSGSCKGPTHWYRHRWDVTMSWIKSKKVL